MSELKGFTSVHDATLSTHLEDSLIEYYDWALLNKGNYFNISLGDEDTDGHDLSRLRMTEIASVDDGRVWSAFRENWVWQSGVTYSPAPLVTEDAAKPGVSGVYVDDVFYPSDTVGDYSHYIDHTNGRVVFDTAIPTGSKVQAEYSYKWINVVYAHNVPWLKELQRNTNKSDGNFLDEDSVKWSKPAEATIQLPAIAVEIVPRRSFKPQGLGGGQWVYQDVLFHCIGESDSIRNKLVDIVSLQNDKTVLVFDNNTVYASGDSPINNYGAVVSGAMQYPELVSSHYGGRIKLTKTHTQDMDEFGTNIYSAAVRVTTEGVKSNI